MRGIAYRTRERGTWADVGWLWLRWKKGALYRQSVSQFSLELLQVVDLNLVQIFGRVRGSERRGDRWRASGVGQERRKVSARTDKRTGATEGDSGETGKGREGEQPTKKKP